MSAPKDWSISSQFVSWRELEPIFKALYPRTIEDCWENHTIATVKYVGVKFEIRPYYTGTAEPYEFRVFGPAHVNPFPERASTWIKD